MTSTSEQVGQLGLDSPAGRLNACSISAATWVFIRTSKRSVSCKAVTEMRASTSLEDVAGGRGRRKRSDVA
jgi:hypothetical protein